MIVNKIYQGNCLDVLKELDSDSVNCCVTSPPYWGLRDYGVSDQLGLEKTPEEYVQKLVDIFKEVKRVLRKDGTLWLNLGDSYARGKGTCYNPGGNTSSYNVHLKASNVHPLDGGNKKTLAASGLKPKDLVGIPWRVAFALQKDGWYLRQDIIWHKPNPMPESVTDRCTKAHEYIFLLSKSAKYYYDADAIKEKSKYIGIKGMDDTGFKNPKKFNGKHKNLEYDGQKTNKMHKNRGNGIPDILHKKHNKRSVWTVNTKPFSEAHFAVFPGKLIEDCIKAGCPGNGIILDPFIGSGTTGIVARKQDKNYIGIELNEKYVKMAQNRITKELGLFE